MTLSPRQRAELTRRVARAHAEVLRRRYGGNWIVVPEPTTEPKDHAVTTRDPTRHIEQSIHVVCIRHPDFSNEFEVFGGSVEIHDVDYGQSNLADPDEYAQWADGWQTTIAELRERGEQAVADCLAEAVRNGKSVK